MKKSIRPQLAIFKDYNELCVKSAQKILAIANEAIQKNGRFTAALSGGNTPQRIYQLMGSVSFQRKIDCHKVDFFLTDERWVPLMHERSNHKMIRRALGPLALCFHPVQTAAASPQVSAQLYEEELKKCFKLKGNECPAFDLVLLGMGEDGHIASLFPDRPALQEKKHLVIADDPPSVPEPRVSLTFPVINRAKSIIFLISGAKKAAMLHRVLDSQEEKLPAQMVRPASGNLCWFIDQAAAQSLKNVSL